MSIADAAVQLATRINMEIVLTRPPTTVAISALSGCIAAQLVRLTMHLPAQHADDIVEAYLDTLRRAVVKEREAPTPMPRRPSINWNGA
jgi:hypothetical protein